MEYMSRTKAPYFSTDKISADGKGVESESPYEVTYQYINGLPEPVTVVERSGMRVTIPSNRQPRMRDFVIRVVVRHTREVNVNIDQLCHGTTPESKILAQVFSEGIMTRHGSNWHYFVDYHIDYEDFRQHGGSLYVGNHDLVLTILNPGRPDLFPDHPFSTNGVHNRMIEEDESINNAFKFGYSLQIVDNGGFFGERFININQQVFKVPVTTDYTKPNGVYLTCSGPVASGHGYHRPVSNHYTFEEADKELSLYRTIDEAKTLGDVFAEKERELQAYKLDVKRQEEKLKAERMDREAEFDRRKAALEAERLEEEERRKKEDHRLSEKQARIKEELAELEHRRQMRSIEAKDGYEQRHYQRKDTSEVVKFLPAIFTGVIALFVAFQKASK